MLEEHKDSKSNLKLQRKVQNLETEFGSFVSSPSKTSWGRQLGVFLEEKAGSGASPRCSPAA